MTEVGERLQVISSLSHPYPTSGSRLQALVLARVVS